MHRRRFLRTAATAAVAAPSILRSAEDTVLGQGDHKFRVVPKWGEQGAATPVKNCHGIVCTGEGRIVLLTDHTKNNVIIQDTTGKVLHKWGTAWPGAHGLSLVKEGAREVLYFTDRQRHRVFKSTLEGELLGEWGWPQDTGKYDREGAYQPSWTLHAPDGSFFVLDGYGRDYIAHYGPDGKFVKLFGGAEGGIVHWGPHGGMMDESGGRSSLLIAMSDQQHLLRMDTDGKKLAQYDLPGGNPRQIRRVGQFYYVAHLGDNWPKDRNCRGFVSVLDENLKVVSNIAGTAPAYGDDGKLQKMKHSAEVFLHPHDLCLDRAGNLYVAQFASGNTWPVKLERV